MTEENSRAKPVCNLGKEVQVKCKQDDLDNEEEHDRCSDLGAQPKV